MGNITTTMPIDVSIKPGIFENIHIVVFCYPDDIRVYIDLFKEFHNVFTWSYKEMSGIDPNIMVHEIPMYPNAKVVR